MKLFFYFNGLNSAIPDDFSNNPKIVAAAEYSLNKGFRFIPVSIDYRHASSHLEEILEQLDDKTKEVIFCGSSMGGWFARIMQLSLADRRQGLMVTAIAFNPAFDISLHQHLLLGPQQNHVTLEEYEWTQANSQALVALEERLDYDADLPFFVYCDKGDEIINWADSAERHSGISRFLAFEGGCHSFDHFNEALMDFNDQSS
jgi:predicted esterase YcpF (UPF0227 family)